MLRSHPGVLRLSLVTALLALAPYGSAHADRIKNPTAVFSGLDKITGRIIAFDVNVDETVQFGSLQLTPRICYTRPPYEAPQTTSFIEVDEIGATKDEFKRLFTGWMFAASPGLSAIDHAVYDIWLTECKGGTEVIKTAPDQSDTPVATLPTTPAPVKKATAATQANAVPRQPTQRYFPTNEPPPPAQAGPRVAPPSFDPASRSGNN